MTFHCAISSNILAPTVQFCLYLGNVFHLIASLTVAVL